MPLRHPEDAPWRCGRRDRPVAGTKSFSEADRFALFCASCGGEQSTTLGPFGRMTRERDEVVAIL